MWREYFHSIDPGFANLRTALRGTLGVFFTFIALYFCNHHSTLPLALVFTGTLIPLFSALVINDASLQMRKKTNLLFAPISLFCLTLSILAAPYFYLKICVFMSVTCIAILLRHLGPRWFALGFIGFIMYFMPLFFPLPLNSLPWVVVTVLIANGISYFFRFVVFGEAPQKMLGLYLEALDLQLREVLKELEKVLLKNSAFGPHPSKNTDLRMRLSMGRLTDLLVTLEQFLSLDAKLTKKESENLQLLILERELAIREAVESCAILIERTQADKDCFEAAQAVQQTRQAMQQHGVLHLQTSRVDLNPFFQSLQRVADSKPHIDSLPDPAPEDLQGKSQNPPRPSFRPTARLAFQVTLATGLASLFGAALSSERWYWASLTAFIVFVGASRGDTSVRALLRVGGTFIGLLLGFLVAQAAGENTNIKLVFIFVSMFWGLFLARRTFGLWSALLFSLIIAILFDVLGQMTSEILILRLEETLVGALIGALVSSLVFPTTTMAVVLQAQGRFLLTCHDVLSELPLAAHRKRFLIQRLRQMDQDLTALKLSAAPLIDVMGLIRIASVQNMIFDSLALSHLIKSLATYPLTNLTEIHLRELRNTLQPLAERLRIVGVSTGPDSRDLNSSIKANIETSCDNQVLPLVLRTEQIIASIEARQLKSHSLICRRKDLF